MNDEDLRIAFALEASILNGCRYLQCGCEHRIVCTFPNAPWLYSVKRLGACRQHALSELVFQGWYKEDGELVPNDVVRWAFNACLKLKLPSLYIERWSAKDRRGLLSLEGEHVIHSSGYPYNKDGGPHTVKWGP